MPIIDIQRRLRELGRIRLGEQVATGNGRRPAKLSAFRLTSRDPHVLEAAAALWGGTVKPWDNGGTAEHELYTDADAIPIVIPPTDMAFSQWYEQWTAGGCVTRCDGITDNITETDCHCDPNPDKRACKATTRLSVMLPDIPGLGLWRVESHGYYAAVELAAAVDICHQVAGAGGGLLPARLRLEARTVKRIVRGKAQTFRFAVPVIDIDVRIGQLAALPTGGGQGGGIAALADPGFTPAGALPAPTVEDQLDAIDNPPPRTTRTAPLPATGLAPRPAAAVVDEAPPAPSGHAHHPSAIDTTAAAEHQPQRDDNVLPLPDPRDDHDRQRRRFHAIAAKRWPDGTRQDARHAWTDQHFGAASLNDLTAQQVAAAADRLQAEVDQLETIAADAPRPAGPPDTSASTWSPDDWRAYLNGAGIKLIPFLKATQDLAAQLGETFDPMSLAALEGRTNLAALAHAWVEEQLEART